jgi:lysozyme
MNHGLLQNQLIRHEGLKLKPYRCTADKLTIGVGRNLDGKGITEEEAMMLLENDIAEVEYDLKYYIFQFVWDDLPEAVQIVLANMRFQLGFMGFRSFKRMIAAVKQLDFDQAAIEMENSKWAKQTPNRACELIIMMKGETK